MSRKWAWMRNPIEQFHLHRARQSYIANETKSVLDALTGKMRYLDESKANQNISPEDTANIVAYHLARGANPNARMLVPVKAELFEMGPYPTLKRRRSFLSMCWSLPLRFPFGSIPA